MAKAPAVLFMEEWLRSVCESSWPSVPQVSQSPSAQDIIQSWSSLRDCLHHQSFDRSDLQSLIILNSFSQSTIYVAEPQAKLLIALSSISSPDSYPLIFRLLYIWARKSGRLSPSVLDSLISAISRIYSLHTGIDTQFVARVVLLLGAISAAPTPSEGSVKNCLDLLCSLLEKYLALSNLSLDFIPEVLSGIGFALLRSDNYYFEKIFGILIGIWTNGDRLLHCVQSGLMLLHLMEWVVSRLMTLGAWDLLELACSEVNKYSKRNSPHFVVIMLSAGILRSLNLSPPSCRGAAETELKNLVEGSIFAVAFDLVSQTRNFTYLNSQESSTRLSLQCISLGLARSGPLSIYEPVLLCLTVSLLFEVFPLPFFYRRAAEGSDVLEVSDIQKHESSLLFKEAGAATSALCSQYKLADEILQLTVENYIWTYCQESYLNHRRASYLLRSENFTLLVALEKVAEAAFVMVVVFASVVAKHKVGSNSKISLETQSQVSVRILVALSCLEYLRRVHLSDYANIIRVVVLTVRENASACISFIKSMPSYFEVTNQQGLSRRKYIWSQDEVQTARIFFYFRVIPTFIEHISHQLFRELVVPTMFLYVQHPMSKVALASHTMFASFLSFGTDMNVEKMMLKEQLIFYYMHRSLEVYPEITPYEGISSVVATLVRHLPAGSPAIFYAIHCLAEKAADLCSKATNQDSNLWTNWHKDSEPCKKVLHLLLCLLNLADIQVLPYLLKLLAKLIFHLPKDGQNVVVEDIYSQVAASNDVTRKPNLVSWLHSVSYLCSDGKITQAANTSVCDFMIMSREENDARARL